MENQKNYILGLDTGTNSIGFCLIDEDNKIVKKNDKYLWGIRLFDSTNGQKNEGGAKDRRQHRSLRRRYNRRRKRIYFLQQLFADEIDAKDNLFFYRLQYSQIEKSENKFILFNDKNFTDKTFYKKYPTIFHLKQHLMNEDELDPRLLYLGIANIIKNRGSFNYQISMNENEKFDSNKQIYKSLNDIKDNCNLNFEIDVNKFENIYFSSEDSKDKKVKIYNFFNIETDKLNGTSIKNKYIKDVCIELLFNSEKSLSSILSVFKDDEEVIVNDTDSDTKLSFNNDDYDEIINELESRFVDDYSFIADYIKSFYSLYIALFLKKFIGNKSSVSEVMIDRYNTFKHQLHSDYNIIKDSYDLSKLSENEIQQKHNEYLSTLSIEEIKKLHLTDIGLKKYVLCVYDGLKDTLVSTNKKPISKDTTFYKIFLQDDEKVANFNSYINYKKSCSYLEFSDFLLKELCEKELKELGKVKDRNEKINSLLEHYKKDNNQVMVDLIENIKSETLFPRIHGNNNNKVPKQFYEYELKQILNKQKNNFQFLTEKDEYGTTIDKIIKIFNFRLDYYVGPVHSMPIDENSKFKDDLNKFSWVKQNPIVMTPWTYDKAIDKKETNENFMKRLKGRCSKLFAEFALPKYSPLIEYVNVLEEINKMNVNGHLLSVDEKKGILLNVYLKEKATTSSIISYLKKSHSNKNEVIKISYANSEKEFKLKNSLSTYKKMKMLLKLDDNFDKMYIDFGYIPSLEKLIEIISIYQDKNLLVKELQQNSEEYGLSSDANQQKEQIKNLKSLNYNGFSRYSKKLLTVIKPDECSSILLELINTNKNLNEIFNEDKYRKLIDEENSLSDDEFKYSKDNIDEKLQNYLDYQYVPSDARRPIIQAYKIIKELNQIVGENNIKEIYIETTREFNNAIEKAKKTKSDRKSQLDELYKKLKEETANVEYVKEQLLKDKNKNFTDYSGNLSDKLFLYCTQLGRDMYTGEQIDLAQIDQYTKDHIYPQSKFFDDSLDNLVLTKANTNETLKSDIYPIPYDKFNWDFKGSNKNDDRFKFYKYLLDKNLISQKKYDRLTRINPLSKEETYNFVSRQINFTSIGVKGLMNLLKIKYPDVKVRLSKGTFISKFRKENNIYKSRLVNNLHHAHDAFLNAIIGRTLNTYFEQFYNPITGEYSNEFIIDGKKVTANPINLLKDEYEDKKTGEKKLKHDIVVNGKLLWKRNATLQYIKSQIYANFNILVSRRTYISNTLISQITLLSKNDIKDNGFYLPRKGPEYYKKLRYLSLNDGIVNKLHLEDISLDNVKKYGGYKQLGYGYNSLIKIKKGKKGDEYRIITTPTALDNSQNKMEDYVLKTYKLLPNEYEYVKDLYGNAIKLKVNTVLKIGKSSICITSKNHPRDFHQRNANEPYYSKSFIQTICKAESLYNRFKEESDNYKNDSIISKFQISDDTLKKQKLEYLSKFYIINHQNDFKNDGGLYVINERTNNLLTIQDLDIAFNSIIDMLKSPICEFYYNQGVIDKLNQMKEEYKKINVIFYSKFILTILDLCQGKFIDLKVFDENQSCKFGEKAINWSIKNNTKIIYKSITGYYSKVIWELDKNGIPHSYSKEKI